MHVVGLSKLLSTHQHMRVSFEFNDFCKKNKGEAFLCNNLRVDYHSFLAFSDPLEMIKTHTELVIAHTYICVLNVVRQRQINRDSAKYRCFRGRQVKVILR